MWSLFEKYLTLVVGDPQESTGGMLFDFIQILQSFFQNCIKYDSKTFLESGPGDKTYFQAMMGNIPHLVQCAKDSDVGLQEGIICFKLICCVLENCTGLVDEVIPDVLQLVKKWLDDEESH